MMISSNRYWVQVDHSVGFSFRGSPSFTISGRSGFGKTTFAEYLLLKIKAQFGAGLAISDVKRSDLSTLVHVIKHGDRMVACTANQTARLLRIMNTNLNNRALHYRGQFGKDWADYGLRPYVILIDEVAALMAEADAKLRVELTDQLKQLILRGRALGMFCILSAQRLDSNVLDKAIVQQAGSAAILGTASNMDYRIAFPTVEDVTRLPRIDNIPGHGLLYAEGQKSLLPQPFIAPDMSAVDIPTVLKELEKRNDSSKYADESGYWQY